MPDYKLLTPGPLTTTDTVKREMLFDHCTWDDDYKKITQEIRRALLGLAKVSEKEYTAVLMQGSGTFGVESVITSAVGPEDPVFSSQPTARTVKEWRDIAAHAGIDHVVCRENYDRIPDAKRIAEYAGRRSFHHPRIYGSQRDHFRDPQRHRSGGQELSEREARTFIVDAMSSFAGVEIPVGKWGIDFLVSSANKCVQGVPGFSFIIARREALRACEGQARSLSLDLYDQWKTMESDGKWRFTSPTHAVLAFARALKELEEEGGIEARNRRYGGKQPPADKEYGGTGHTPLHRRRISGADYHHVLLYRKTAASDSRICTNISKQRGYAIYPGKVTEAETFRIGNIGEIYPEDIQRVCGLIREFIETQQ